MKRKMDEGRDKLVAKVFGNKYISIACFIYFIYFIYFYVIYLLLLHFLICTSHLTKQTFYTSPHCSKGLSEYPEKVVMIHPKDISGNVPSYIASVSKASNVLDVEL